MNAEKQHGSTPAIRPPRMIDRDTANNLSFSNLKKGSKDAQMTLTGGQISPLAAGVCREWHNAVLDGEIPKLDPDLSRHFRQRSLELEVPA